MSKLQNVIPYRAGVAQRLQAFDQQVTVGGYAANVICHAVITEPTPQPRKDA